MWDVRAPRACRPAVQGPPRMLSASKRSHDTAVQDFHVARPVTALHAVCRAAHPHAAAMRVRPGVPDCWGRRLPDASLSGSARLLGTVPA